MATYSSLLAWKIPWIEEPGGLQSIELQSRTQLKRLSIHAFRLVWLVVITLDNTTRDPQTAYAPTLWIHLVPSFQNQI